MYFIVVDSNDNVFGHYHPSIINLVDRKIIDNKIFVFTLNSNGRSEVRSYRNIGNEARTYIFAKGYFYGNACYRVYRIDVNESYVHGDLGGYYRGLDSKVFTGNVAPNHFTVRRLIVIEMK